MKDLFERHGERLTERERVTLWERIETARRGGGRRGARAWRPAAAAALALALIGGVLLVARLRDSRERGVMDLAANRQSTEEGGVTDGGAPAVRPGPDITTEPMAQSQSKETVPRSRGEAAPPTWGADALREDSRPAGAAEAKRGDEVAAKSRPASREAEGLAGAPSAAQQEIAGGVESGGAADAPTETTMLASAAPASGATDIKYEFHHRAINTVADTLSKEAGVVEADGRSFVRRGRWSAPFTETDAQRLSSFRLGATRASYDETRRTIESGRLPAGDRIRVDEFVNAFPQRDQDAVIGDFAISLEGAPPHFPPHDQSGFHLIRIVVRLREPSSHAQSNASVPEVEVEFDPTVARRYRMLAVGPNVADVPPPVILALDAADRRNAAKASGTSPAPDGPEVAAIYEVQLVEGVNAGSIATARIRSARPATEGKSGAADVVEARIAVSDLAPNFDSASPRFRLAAIAAEFAEILRGSDASVGTRIAVLVPLARRLAEELPDDPDVAEFARLVERTTEIVGSESPSQR